MYVYILTMACCLGISTAIKIYWVLTDNMPQRNKKTEALSILEMLGFTIWAIILIT